MGNSKILFKSGTTTKHNSFIGDDREITVDTDKKTLVLHDGNKIGGYPLAKESQITDLTNQLNSKLDTESITTLVLQDNKLKFTDENSVTHEISLSSYIDDTNLARITSGNIDNAGIATFTRDDGTNFTINMSSFLDDTKLSAVDITGMGFANTIDVESNTGRIDDMINDNFKITHPDGSFQKILGVVKRDYEEPLYAHVKLNARWNEHSMTMFKVVGFAAYSSYIESYLGCYLYGAVGNRLKPYGMIMADKGPSSCAADMYNSALDTGYLVLVLRLPSHYTGVRIEHIGGGGPYGSRMRPDLDILEVGYSETIEPIF